MIYRVVITVNVMLEAPKFRAERLPFVTKPEVSVDAELVSREEGEKKPLYEITLGQTKSDNINQLLLFSNRWVVNGTVKWDHIELMITLPSVNIKQRSLYKNFMSQYVSGLGKFLFGTSSMYEQKERDIVTNVG
jgi:hypothetical protein